jgi:hypothetical protein
MLTQSALGADPAYPGMGIIHTNTMYVDWFGIRQALNNEPGDGTWTGGNQIAPTVQTVRFTVLKIDPLGLFVGGAPNCGVKVYDNNNMLILSNVQTGLDGSISFQMYRSQPYTVAFTNLSMGINKTWNGYPSDTDYTVYVWPWEFEWTPGKAGPDSELKTITSFIVANLNESDNNNGDINVYYNDTTLQSSNIIINVYKRLNMTSDQLVGSYTTSNNNFNKIFYIEDVKGEDYKVVVTADNAYYGVVKRSFTWTFPGLRYSIPGLPAMAYVWISFIVPLLVALTVSARNLRFGPIVFCAMSWGFNTLGWTSELGIAYPLILAVATFFSVLFIFNQKAREGGY